MKQFLLAFLLIQHLWSGAQITVVPASVKPFIMPGYEVYDLVKGDLTSDKKPDYILILKTVGEDTMTFDNVDWEAPRPLLLLIAQADGSLKAAASNTSLVLCKQCGGMMGDPYQSTTIKPFQFVIDFYGGSSWRWSTSYTFRYDKVKKDWFLYSDASTSFQSGDPDNTTEHSIVMRKETGDISLQNFTPYYNADSSIWKVNAAKAFFYRSPQLGSGPKKLYLVKGDIVNSYKKLNNFIQCSFTNAKGVTTSGYILKRDLLLIEANKPKAIQ